jgi:general secretion pathway protein D
MQGLAAFVNAVLENIMVLKFKFALLICMLIIIKVSPACAQNTGNERYRVFLLRNITPQDAMQLLADANIAKASQLSDENMLLVTADQESLVMASNMLKLVDSPEKYVVKVLIPASDADKMPSVGEIETELSAEMQKLPENYQTKGKLVSIGTFLSPPGNTTYKVILDTHNESLIAVAPVSIMSKITALSEKSVYGKSQLAYSASDVGSQPTSNSQNEPNAIFNSLLSSLDKAEKNLAKVQQEVPAGKPQLNAEKPDVTDIGTVKTDASASFTDDTSEEKPDGKGKTISPEPNKPDVNLTAEQPSIQETEKDDNAVNVYEPKFVPNADETLELTLPDKLSIISLLDLVGKYLNLNYVYDENKIRNIQVNLRIQGPIKVSELYPLVESVMKFTNLVMTRKGNLVTIVPLGEAMDVDPMLIDGSGDRVEAGDVAVTRIFQLNYIDTTNAKTLLEGMKLGAVTELKNMGTIIVTGYAYRMNRIEHLLEVVDKPGKPRQFKFRQLRYTMAKTMAPKIKGLIDQLGDISAVVAAPATPAPRTARGRRAPVRPTPAQPATSAKTSIYLDADERTNRILMIGNEDELAIVENLIDSLDVAQQDLRTLRVYEIQHVDAEEVRKKLEALGIVGASRETATTRGRITVRSVRGEQGQPAAPPTPSPASASQTAGSDVELPSEELQVVIIESTNSLMVNATPEQHSLIASIIAYVDSESIQQAIPYVVYPLQNQPPEHIAEVLDRLVKEVIQDREGKIEKIITKTDQDVTIVPDPSTFSLIVYASKKNQDWIASLIKTLDRRRPQVLIDVTLCEVTNIDQFALDLQLATKFPAMEPGGTMDSDVTSIVSPFISDGDKRNFSTTEMLSNPSADFGVGGTQGFYSDRHIQALLTAMETKSYGRILAKPKILVNDGQRGSIKTTDTTNISIQTAIVPQEGGNPQISTSYQPYTAGITLEIQPNIGEGDLLLLIIRLDRTDFVEGGATNAPPNTKANTVDTIVTVPNNKTIILGGLLKLNQSKGTAKVPLLGDIPIVGGLFRSTSNTVNDSKLYVFVRANILRPEDSLTGLPELESISEKNRAAFEDHEDKFQKHQSWPGIKPKPVDPVHVLDAE